MKRKYFVLLVCMLISIMALTGCSLENEADLLTGYSLEDEADGLACYSLEDEADVASYNVSKEADNFNVFRKVTVMNNQSDMVMLEFEGWCSIIKDNSDNQLEVTYRVGEDTYYTDFIGLNDRTTYVVNQIDGSNVDKYHYEWLYHSEGDLIPIETKDADK